MKNVFNYEVAGKDLIIRMDTVTGAPIALNACQGVVLEISHIGPPG